MTIGKAEAIAACGREHRMNFALTCPHTRRTKSEVAASSIGTTIAPNSAQPKNADTHSAEFGPQITTRSPFSMARASSSQAKRNAVSATCRYDQRTVR